MTKPRQLILDSTPSLLLRRRKQRQTADRQRAWRERKRNGFGVFVVRAPEQDLRRALQFRGLRPGASKAEVEEKISELLIDIARRWSQVQIL